jgi:RimJ/RimL family protein N-acetyltransferase
MVLGYRLSRHGDTPKLAGLCSSLRPLSSLETRAPASFYVNTLAVHPRDRNRGLGGVLLEAAERKARKAHCSCLILEVAESNEGALRFYRRHGFSAWPAVDSESSGDAMKILVLEKAICKGGERVLPCGENMPAARKTTLEFVSAANYSGS